MPSLNGTRRRHSKQPSSSSSSLKKGSTSVISAVSNSSTSSSATVTSRSIFQSSLRPSKRPGGKREPAQLPEPHHGLTANVDKQQLNVFAFMEHEEGDYNSEDAEDKGQAEHTPEELPSSAPSSERLADLPQKSPRYSHLEVRAIQDGVQRAWGRASLHSDSGISVRSPSPDQESPILQHKFKLPTVLDEQDTQEGDARVTHGLQLTRDPSNDPNPAFSHGNWPLMESDQDQYLETYYAPSPPHSAQTAQNPGGLMPEHSPRLPNQLVRGMSRQEIQQQRPSKCGYEFLASNIHAKGDALLKPIYRKFETLNNRMLLYLQDEISEMEDHLREIDNAIAHGEQGTDGRPASRRAEAKSPSQLQWHRLDLLGRSFAKIEQYSEGTLSFC